MVHSWNETALTPSSKDHMCTPPTDQSEKEKVRNSTHCKGALPTAALQVGLQRAAAGGSWNLDGHRVVV